MAWSISMPAGQVELGFINAGTAGVIAPSPPSDGAAAVAAFDAGLHFFPGRREQRVPTIARVG